MNKNIFFSFFKVLSIVLFITYINPAKSQTIVLNDSPSARLLTNIAIKSSSSGKLNNGEIYGSAYLSDEFILGNIITAKDTQFLNIPLRYNIYKDIMEFKTSENSIFSISNNKTIREIQLGKEVFIYCKTNKHKAGYFSLRYSGDVQLLSKYSVKYEPATSSALYKAPTPPTYERGTDKLFIRTGNNYPVQISKKKDLEKIFGDKCKEIYSFIKKEKLKVRKENDLKKIVEYIDHIN